jgi:hypothetical protein
VPLATWETLGGIHASHYHHHYPQSSRQCNPRGRANTKGQGRHTQAHPSHRHLATAAAAGAGPCGGIAPAGAHLPSRPPPRLQPSAAARCGHPRCPLGPRLPWQRQRREAGRGRGCPLARTCNTRQGNGPGRTNTRWGSRVTRTSCDREHIEFSGLGHTARESCPQPEHTDPSSAPIEFR